MNAARPSAASARLARGLVPLLEALRGLRFGRYHCRPAAEWQRRLAEAGFRVETHPMSQGSPFANVLMVARGA